MSPEGSAAKLIDGAIKNTAAITAVILIIEFVDSIDWVFLSVEARF